MIVSKTTSRSSRRRYVYIRKILLRGCSHLFSCLAHLFYPELSFNLPRPNRFGCAPRHGGPYGNSRNSRLSSTRWHMGNLPIWLESTIDQGIECPSTQCAPSYDLIVLSSHITFPHSQDNLLHLLSSSSGVFGTAYHLNVSRLHCTFLYFIVYLMARMTV